MDFRGRGSRCNRCFTLGFPDALSSSHFDVSSRGAHVKTHLIVDWDILPAPDDPFFNRMMDDCFPQIPTDQNTPNAGDRKTEPSKKPQQVNGRKKGGGASTISSCVKCGFRPNGKMDYRAKLNHVLSKHTNCRFRISCGRCNLGWRRKLPSKMAEHFNKFHPGFPVSFKDARERAKVKRLRAECFPDRRPKTRVVHNKPKEMTESKRPSAFFTCRSKTCQICGFTLQQKDLCTTVRWCHVAKEHAQNRLFSCVFCCKSSNLKHYLLQCCRRRHPSQACQLMDNRPKLQKIMDQCFPLKQHALSTKKKYRGQGKRIVCKLCQKTVSDNTHCRWGHASHYHSASAIFACPLCYSPGHRVEIVQKHLLKLHPTQNPQSVEIIDRRGKLSDVYYSCFP